MSAVAQIRAWVRARNELGDVGPVGSAQPPRDDAQRALVRPAEPYREGGTRTVGAAC